MDPQVSLSLFPAKVHPAPPAHQPDNQKVKVVPLKKIAIFLAGAAFFAACPRKPFVPKPYVAYVACNGGGTVAVVDLASFRTIASVQVAPHPVRVLPRPKTHQVFAFSNSGEVSVIEFPSEKVVQKFKAGQSIRDPWFSADGSRLYLLDPVESRILILDAARGTILRAIQLADGASTLALTPDGKTLIASVSSTNRVYFADAQTGKMLGSVEVGKGPGPLAVLPDSRKAFVADTNDDKVSAVDIEGRSLISNIEIGSKPDRLALKPDGGELFVFSNATPTMTILDTSQDDVEQNFPAGRDVSGWVFSGDSSTLYLATADGGFVSFFDVANRAVTSAIHVSISPGAMALTPDERFLVVVSRGSGELDVLETNPPSLLTTVPVGSDPVDVAIPGWVLRK